MTHRKRRGSVLVEISLIFVLFAVLLIGIMDFSQFLFHQQALVERARYAARWGVINGPGNSAAIRDVLLYNQTPAPPAAPPFFGLTAENVSVSTYDSGTDNYRLVVRISGYSYRVLSPWLAGSYLGAPITVSVPIGLYN